MVFLKKHGGLFLKARKVGGTSRDRLASDFFWTVDFSEYRDEFRDWIRKNPSSLNMNDAQYLIDGHVVIDDSIRYENLEADITELEETVPALHGLWQPFSRIKAKGGIRPKNQRTQDLFSRDQAMIDAVLYFNQWQHERFGYDLNN